VGEKTRRVLTRAVLKLSLDVQNPLAVSPDELGDQRAIVLDRGRRVDGPQEGRASRNLELYVRRLRRGAGVEQAVRVAGGSVDDQLAMWTHQRRRDGKLVR